jgi:hypothetical protein
VLNGDPISKFDNASCEELQLLLQDAPGRLLLLVILLTAVAAAIVGVQKAYIDIAFVSGSRVLLISALLGNDQELLRA